MTANLFVRISTAVYIKSMCAKWSDYVQHVIYNDSISTHISHLSEAYLIHASSTVTGFLCHLNFSIKCLLTKIFYFNIVKTRFHKTIIDWYQTTASKYWRSFGYPMPNLIIPFSPESHSRNNYPSWWFEDSVELRLFIFFLTHLCI